MDAKSDVEKVKINNRRLEGIEDIDGDGRSEIFASDNRTLFIYNIEGKSYQEKCRLNNVKYLCLLPEWSRARPVSGLIDYGLKNSLVVADIDGDGIKEVFCSAKNRFYAYDLSSDVPKEKWSCKIPEGRIVGADDVDGDGEIEVLIDTPGSLKIIDKKGNLKLVIETGGRLTNPLVADLNNDGKNEVILHDRRGKVKVLDASTANLTTPPQEVDWSYKGKHRQGLGAQPIFVDLSGDGYKEIILQKSGKFTLGVFNYKGEVIWTKKFPKKIIYFGLGIFNLDAVIDIFVKTEKPLYYTLDGMTGKKIWVNNPDAAPTPPGGEYIPATADLDGDGRDELVMLHRFSIFYSVGAYSGYDGLLMWRTKTYSKFLCGSGTIIIDSQNKIVTSGNAGVIKIDAQGELIWGSEIHSGAPKNFFGSLVDSSNDGIPELIQPTYAGLFCFDGKTGKIFWYFHPGPNVSVSSCVGADINGDGKKEIIVSANDNNLYSLKKTDGSVLWDFDFAYQMGEPIVADVDSDGEAEILVSSNGYLYCLDKSYVPYLKIFESDITFSNPTPISGERTEIKASVRNWGGKEALEVVVAFYDNGSIIGKKYVDIPRRAIVPVTINWKPKAGHHKIEVRMEKNNQVCLAMRGVTVRDR